MRRVKVVAPSAPDCCLCARSDRNHKGQRCAHEDAHRYCADHQAQIDGKTHQPLCHAHAKNTYLDEAGTLQATCSMWALKGAAVCGHHGGSTRASKAKQRKNIAQANAYAKAEIIRERRGFARELDPLQVLRFCLDEATNWVHIWLTEVQRISAGKEAKLIGPNHLGDQALDVAYQCYTDALDRAAKYAKLCLDAGVADRLAKVEEARLEMIGTVMLAIAADLGLDETEARPLIAARLRALPAA